MTDLFLDILNLSFSATWVVLAVVLARLLLKKAPRWMICSLWALVALRLLFGGIEAPFSLIPSSEIIPPDSLFDQAPVIDSGVSSIDDVINPIYSESLRPMPGASVNPLQVWLAVFANLWGLGMGAMAIWAGISCFRVLRRVRECIPAEDGVFLCDRIASPFIFGLFRPKIYLPSDLGRASRDHVIAHERAHLKRRDHWWKPLGFLLLTVNWFNPAMWLAYVLLCRDIELACDEKVVRDFGVEEKKAYSAALLRCSINARHITACPLAFGEVGVKQRIKSVLHYRKPTFWIILAAAVLTAVLALGLLTNPMSPDPEIRWDGVLYVQDGRALKELPADAVDVGILRSTLHDQTTHPDENGQSVHLAWEFAGQPLYLADETLFIEEPGGKKWLPFVPKHSPADVLALLDSSVQIDLTLEDGNVSIRENIRDYSIREDRLGLSEILAADSLQMHPTLSWDPSMLAVNYTDDVTILMMPSDYEHHCLLVRGEADWLMVYRDEDWAVSAWTFACPELDAALAPWQNELAYATELFSEFAAEAPICLDYLTASTEDIALRLGTPAYRGWGISVSHEDNAITIHCDSLNRNTELRIRYIDTQDTHYATHLRHEPITLPNGATGTLYHSGDPSRWELITLDTARGQILIDPDPTNGPTDWTVEDYRMALTILGTLSLTENGNSLFGDPNPLGISMSVENVTPNGATLVCTQDGTLWTSITTGSPWNLERFEDGSWVSVIPESTVWTTIAYGINLGQTTSWNINWSLIAGTLEPGQYRVSKTFTGERRPMFTLGLENEEVQQTSYAEFIIE